jgi:hypothetical protein
MADKGLKSKRRWAQWLSFAAAVAGPAALAMFPQYAVPIGSAVAAVTALSAELVRRSKNKETDNV